MSEQRTEMKTEWRHEGYDASKGCHILGYYKNGLKVCEMSGYDQASAGRYKVYPRKLVRFEFPKVQYVYYQEIKG